MLWGHASPGFLLDRRVCRGGQLALRFAGLKGAHCEVITAI